MSTASCYDGCVRRYRRNGTPIGDRKVYVAKPGWPVQVWEVAGCSEWEQVQTTILLEALGGSFGPDFDVSKSIIVMPGVDLRHLDLYKARLPMSDMTAAMASGSKFYGSYLAGANLMGSDFSDANFRGSVLRSVDFREANLRRSIMSESDLSGADFRGANLDGAEMMKADLRGTLLDGVNCKSAALLYSKRNANDGKIEGWRVVRGVLERA